MAGVIGAAVAFIFVLMPSSRRYIEAVTEERGEEVAYRPPPLGYHQIVSTQWGERRGPPVAEPVSLQRSCRPPLSRAQPVARLA